MTAPAVTLVSAAGVATRLAVPPGWSVMAAAVAAGVDGIVGECGGSQMCATCHVYVDPAHTDRLPPMGPTEDAMLDSAAAPRLSNSRLSCQIASDPALDGLTLRLPDRQK